mgnify:CR=1 FL=1
MKKRLVSMLLVLVMVLGMLPVTALAASSEEEALGEVNIYNGEQKLSYLSINGRIRELIYTYFNHVDANGRTKEIPAYCVNPNTTGVPQTVGPGESIKYIAKEKTKKKFSVSMQHYTFAVSAFVELVKQFGMDEYEFAVHETKTYDVIDDVKNFRSEIGILYVNDFNQKVLYKLFRDCGLEFHELLRCGIYVYLWKGHPLANRKLISLEDLREYPCLSFDQGAHGSFYFAEEVLSTYEYKRIIKANDRATLLNLMIGLLTPPFGLVLFVISKIGHISIGRFSKALVPWLGALLAALLLVTFIPQLSLWFPTMLGMSV